MKLLEGERGGFHEDADGGEALITTFYDAILVDGVIYERDYSHEIINPSFFSIKSDVEASDHSWTNYVRRSRQRQRDAERTYHTKFNPDLAATTRHP